MKNTVSLCMIVKNEALFIERCLKSVKDEVDEIIIVDTGSTDDTIALAERFGARIYHFPWKNDFASARNYSLQQATCPYILVLDADEYLDESSHIQDILHSQKKGYSIRVRNQLEDGMVKTTSILRVFQSSPSIRFTGQIHEQIMLDSSEIEETGFLIHHVGYRKDVYALKNKAERNIRILLEEVASSPSAYAYYNVGKQYLVDGENELALEFLIKARNEMSYQESIDVLGMEIDYNLADCYYRLHQPEYGIPVLNRTIQQWPEYTDLYFMQARLFEQMGYWKDAEQYFKKCISLGDMDGEVAREGVGGYLAHFLLSRLYESQGNLQGALEHAFHALHLKKDYMPCLENYISLAQKAGVAFEVQKECLNFCYPVKKVDELTTLIGLLYKYRHPLLQEYITQYGIHNDIALTACGLQYSGQYEEARLKWCEVDGLHKNNLEDVILLSLLIDGERMMEKIRTIPLLTEQQIKTIISVIKKENLSQDRVDAFLGQVLLTLCERCIRLGEFDCFEYVSGLIRSCGLDIQYQLALLLDQSGFKDVAFDFMVSVFESQERTAEIEQFVGSRCLERGYREDAKHIFLQLAHTAPSYDVYLSLYELLLLEEAPSQARELLSDMKNRFPLSAVIQSL
ncbi:glycosyltransferase [Paenibacillus sp. 32352]|uniref:tetratricopeptide repeat-containing glycosyltransferase family 2 protein n=1 Tax=Paenibacillus sp. 32352 TaxID=1969111 RepID=UPI0009AE0FBC|nr:glycosyltransferase [Paenibacillus sp. 32352]